MEASVAMNTVKPEDEGESTTVNQLIAELHTHDGPRRQNVREQLVTLGRLAAFPLIDALEDPDWHVRWEAAKALHDIGDARAAPALVKALRDRRFAVRWLASDALISLKEAALPALLESLVFNADSVFLRSSAHHVLRDLSHGGVGREVAEVLKPVISALEGLESSMAVPMAARTALDKLPKRIRKGAAA